MVLTMLLACPLVGMVLILMLPKTSVRLIRLVALAATAAALLCTMQILLAYQPGVGGVQFQERLAWIPQMQIFYHLGVDGINLPMVGLTALLSFLACIGSFSITERHKEYFAIYLLLELGMLGTFLA